MRKIYLGKILITCLSFVFMQKNAHSFEYGNLQVQNQLGLRNEFNDNVNFADGKTEKAKKDFVFNITPSINALLPYKEHRFMLNFRSDYRKGTSTNLSEFNINTNGSVNLNFVKNLKVILDDTYSKTTFDQQLSDNETGLSDRQSNTYGAKVSYVFVKRLNTSIGYNHRWEEFDDKPVKTARNIDSFNGDFSIPLSETVYTYFNYRFQTQDSKERTNRNFDDNSFQLGLRWEGPNRFSFWFDGGYQKRNYENAQTDDFKNAFGEVGIKILFTEKTDFDISFGKDGYGNTAYDGSLTYNYSEDFNLSASVRRNTQDSFSESISSTFQSTYANLQIKKKFIEKISASLNAGLQLNKFDSSVTSATTYKTWVSGFNFDYSIQKWVKVGSSYQYFFRDAKKQQDKYTNNRAGVYFNFVF
ncbi:outer membrane beta-barrel protein [bacterium]|nr:outer membrane beta-barrel protein [bacterium]